MLNVSSLLIYTTTFLSTDAIYDPKSMNNFVMKVQQRARGIAREAGGRWVEREWAGLKGGRQGAVGKAGRMLD